MSQPAQIVLSVDEDNSGSGFQNHQFDSFDWTQPNRTVYIGPNHSNTSRNTLAIYRTMPKVSGNFRGVQKSAAKFTKDTSVLGVNGDPIIAPIIFDMSFSIPVGATNAEVLIERQKGIALLDLDTIMVALNMLGMI